MIYQHGRKQQAQMDKRKFESLARLLVRIFMPELECMTHKAEA